MGAFPTHSTLDKLHENFSQLEELALRWILHKQGLVTQEGKPTKKAGSLELLAICDRTLLWQLEPLVAHLALQGDQLERRAVNQTPTRTSSGDPQWVNLSTLGTYFSASGVQVGTWLDALELREEDGMATKESLDRGLAVTVEMNAGPKKTRKITQWNLELVQELLMEAGHHLDFDYEKSLKGKGKNSDVKVETVESRARDFAKLFTKLFKDPQERRTLPALVAKTPKPIQKQAEELLKRPGFITQGHYLKHLDRE